jgi:zinc D-Ala-D-Ala carboxypeptidase
MPQPIDGRTPISRNFVLWEFTKSQTATRLDIDNNVYDQKIVNNLKALAAEVLQPIRETFGSTNINSGFRCLTLNRALKSSDKSQHTKGEAADVECFSVANDVLAAWIYRNCEFDQLILEFFNETDPRSGWVHVSLKADGKNRKQSLIINKQGTRVWTP